MLTTYLIHTLPAEARRGFNLKEAASYVGMSAGYFKKLVQAGLMPAPLPLPGVKRWDKRGIDKAMDLLSGRSVAPNASALDQWRAANGAN